MAKGVLLGGKIIGIPSWSLYVREVVLGKQTDSSCGKEQKKKVSIEIPSKNEKCKEISFSVKLQNIIMTLTMCIKIPLVVTTQNHGEGWSGSRGTETVI